MNLVKRIFDFRGAPVLGAAFVALFIAEGRRQLRKRKQPRLQRMVINSIVAIPAFTLLRFLFLPVMVKAGAEKPSTAMGIELSVCCASVNKRNGCLFDNGLYQLFVACFHYRLVNI